MFLLGQTATIHFIDKTRKEQKTLPKKEKEEDLREEMVEQQQRQTTTQDHKSTLHQIRPTRSAKQTLRHKKVLARHLKTQVGL